MPSPTMRDAFELPSEGPYLLAHSVGCLPVAARGALEQGLFAPWAARGGDGWGQWLGAIAGFRSALAALLGGRPDQWCPQPCISTAVSRLLSGLDISNGRTRILISSEAFPSIGYAAGGLARLGFQVDLVNGDPADIASWTGIRDADVAVVIAMHVHSNSGRVSPVAEIAALAREAGVFSIVDIAQSAGILPIAVEAWGVDAVVGTSVKWLCGGPGACFLWIDPVALPAIHPMDRGWFSHENPFEMDIMDFRYAADSRRFWGGTPSVAPFVIAASGIETIRAIGVERIRSHNLEMASTLARTLGEAAAEQCDLASRGGTICLTLPPKDDEHLRRTGCYFDRRDDKVRLSLGPWNDEHDVAILAEALTAAGM